MTNRKTHRWATWFWIGLWISMVISLTVWMWPARVSRYSATAGGWGATLLVVIVLVSAMVGLLRFLARAIPDFVWRQRMHRLWRTGARAAGVSRLRVICSSRRSFMLRGAVPGSIETHLNVEAYETPERGYATVAFAARLGLEALVVNPQDLEGHPSVLPLISKLRDSQPRIEGDHIFYDYGGDILGRGDVPGSRFDVMRPRARCALEEYLSRHQELRISIGASRWDTSSKPEWVRLSFYVGHLTDSASEVQEMITEGFDTLAALG